VSYGSCFTSDVPRTDPTDTGGLFVGRRPGTAPVRYRGQPPGVDPGRARFERVLAAAILVVMTLVSLTYWGPQPALWLWAGSQIQYLSDSVSLGILCAFLGLLGTLMLGLVLLKRLDHAWILVRRAAGYDQREGMLARIFATSAIIGGIIFTGWLLLFSGASLAPLGIGT
jgi:hypothetical protein